MQNRYFGDIGDYFKYGLLRALGQGRTLGVAWYLYPDEGHNEDGKHIAYLDDAAKWRGYDPELFDQLQERVKQGRRNVREIENSGLLGRGLYAYDPLDFDHKDYREKAAWRQRWFDATCACLQKADIVFADPDNGLCLDDTFRASRRKDWKRLPVSEAIKLAQNSRPAILYHHNSRFPGGHDKEVAHWIDHLPGEVMAIRWRAYSPRTFFVLNSDDDIKGKLEKVAVHWAPHTILHR